MDEQTRKVLEAYPVPWTVDVRDTGLVSLLDSTGYALVRMNAARANVEWLTLAATAVNAYAAQQEQAVRRQRDNDVALVRRFADTGKLSKAQREAVLAAADALACDEFDAALKEAPDGT